MGFLDFFKKGSLKSSKTQTWREFGGYHSNFSSFSGNIFSSEIVRSSIRPLAEFSSKATAKCSDPALEKLLNNRPNLYMNGHDFIYKIRMMLEIQNTAFVYIQRDERLKVTGLYPVPYVTFEALEYANGLFIRFRFSGTTEPIVLPWEDIAVIRKDYFTSDIAGESNAAILNTLEMIQTTNQGIANAIRSTANLRGILKSTKAMLKDEDVKRQKETFVNDYMNLENQGGIASLDATQEFTPISMSPIVASAEQIKEFREDVYRYFGVNDDIIMSRMNAEQIEAFYELRVEPFLVALSNELTSKIYTNKAQSFGNWIVYEANKLQFASLDKKITLYKEVVLYGGMTINEWRLGCNMSPLPDGDKTIMRLDAAKEGDDGTED